MTNRTAQEQTRFRHLLTAYKAAFKEWSLQVRFRHASPGSTAAQVAYRDSRDLLADFMLERPKIKASCGRRSSSALTEVKAP